jgi:voltage-gated potassium channel
MKAKASGQSQSVKTATQALLLVLAMIGIGTVGFYIIGAGDWPLEECFYMTVITISTVGYGEVVPLEGIPHARLFAVLMILFGMGTMVYFGSTVVALVVERDIGRRWREKKMEREIASLSNHVIVCGAGTVGQQVILELVVTRTPFVIIENEEKRIDAVTVEFGLRNPPYIIGDATDYDILKMAGIERARGIIITLPSDKDSLITTVTARQMNRNVRIVSRCHEPDTVQRILKAGANSVVSPNVIGGMRLVSEMIRPQVVEFLDLMLRDKDKNLRIEEVPVPDGSDLVGKKLQDAWIRKITSLLVIAVRDTKRGTYTYNPGPDFELSEGNVLILLGTSDDVFKLRETIRS